jgi:DNA-binding GntR family transcriptional regulator
MNVIYHQSLTSLDELLSKWNPGRSSTVDIIFELLREAIVRGDLPQGMPLRQDYIANKLGISKVPLREALAKLEAFGFVTIYPRRGVVVSEVKAETIDEIFHMRLALEPGILRVAVPRLRAEDLARAEEIIGRFETSEGTRDLGKLNWKFHRTLYEPSRMLLTLQFLDNLHLHVDRYVRLHMGLVDLSRNSNNEHRALVAACQAGETERAVQILYAHIENIRLAIRELIEPDGVVPTGERARAEARR